ncbi:jg9071 [Pararge aegeria aegeria]|uniref:Jg9071 protein n=1 Tax=Pararge aegeria aegeria TaxID=348720 RepID=A0A8S4RV17_9NEOP|nr:jg9071 [Pararge aegeria aegeria]
MDVGVSRCWNGSPELVSAALVDPQRGGQTTLSASQVAAGSKRLRTVEFETPYKRPMSSSGRVSVDVMTTTIHTSPSSHNARGWRIKGEVCHPTNDRPKKAACRVVYASLEDLAAIRPVMIGPATHWGVKTLARVR